MKLDSFLFIIISCTGVITILYFWHFFGATPTLDFLVQWTATMIGVMAAFQFSVLWDNAKDSRRQRTLLTNLSDELHRVKENADYTKYGVQMTYPDIWDSKVSSGALSLLDSQVLSQLASVYRTIKGLQYEALRVRDAIEDCNRVPPEEKSIKAYLEARASVMRTRYQDQAADVIKRIGIVLMEPWWPKNVQHS